MALSLSDMKTTADFRPPLITIHAVEGIGKTSLASEFPNPIYISTPGERPPNGISMPTPGQLSSFDDLKSIINELLSTEHDRETFIIDSIDGIEPMIWAETCRRDGRNWADIEAPGYGKGYVLADEPWSELMEGLDYLIDSGMTVIMLCHSDRVSHEEPGVQPYKRYDLRIHKRAQAIICDASDYILFVNSKTDIKAVDVGFNKSKTHAEGGGQRYIFTDARPAFIAKNRALKMPDSILYLKGKGFEKLKPHMFPHLIEDASAKAAKEAA